MLNCGWLFWFCWGISLMELPSGGPRGRGQDCWKTGESWRGEQGIEAAGAIEGREVVVAPDMPLAHVDLRHGAPAGAADHLVAARRIEVHADLLDLGHALGAQQPLGLQAEGAHARRIHHDLRHLTSPRAGSPAARPRAL